jgi:hypothetical protein
MSSSLRQERIPDAALIIIFLIFGLAATSSATIINIPADYPTIQQGIDASVDGDTVLVQPNVYREHLILDSKEITLASNFLLSGNRIFIDSTIIDGDSSGTVITMYSCGAGMLLTGFTITRGDNQLYGAGGIDCINSNAIIRSNIVTKNTSKYASGIFCDSSDVQIIGNIISFNKSSYNNSYGGAITCEHSNPQIISNVIYGNYVRRSAHRNGGAISSIYSSPIIKNNIIWANIPTSIFSISYSDPIVEYCLLQTEWEGIGNISLDPRLIDPEAGNFNVCQLSQCIDAGDPNMTDPDGTRSDIGIYFAEHDSCPSENSWYTCS